MIDKIKETLGQFFHSPEASGTWDDAEIECAIDEEVVDCDEMDNPPYVGVPAPAYLEDDPWFGPAPVRSEKQLDYMQQETLIKQQQHQETHSGEPENIHELMYEMSTANWNTVGETQGASENFHEGWQSGTGFSQFN